MLSEARKKPNKMPTAGGILIGTVRANQGTLHILRLQVLHLPQRNKNYFDPLNWAWLVIVVTHPDFHEADRRPCVT